MCPINLPNITIVHRYENCSIHEYKCYKINKYYLCDFLPKFNITKSPHTSSIAALTNLIHFNTTVAINSLETIVKDDNRVLESMQVLW